MLWEDPIQFSFLSEIPWIRQFQIKVKRLSTKRYDFFFKTHHRNISKGRFCLEMMVFFHTWPVAAQILIIFSITSCNGFKFNARPTFTQKKITFSFRIMTLWHPIYCKYIWQIIVLTRRFLEWFGGNESHLKSTIIQSWTTLNTYYRNL